ncbi:aldehyde dehydrogenase family protein [Saccharopolyspora karakumensis]|uniref:Aldehyde dehydrogenase family protein n=1 Tax=Saccharopolyspora karakumensis TaxID=2530386 RepID=A0A4R5BMC3_9PSEU|nr:aldehyde dehydrogenase family protein [Saccharopolyspora karakumensis]TDD87055.1 aldehyde dehydrogenase family protein [Saccharopolyspora karakumensis]
MSASAERTSAAAAWITDAGEPGASVVLNPASERPIAAYRNATGEDVDSAVKAAVAAAPAWGRTPPGERAEILLKIADAIEGDAEEFVQRESENVGRPITHTHEETPWWWDVIRFSAGAARASHAPAAGEYANDSTSWLRREPLGVVGLITPWNYPMLMGVWKIFPAIAAGNAVVIKPSELTPETTIRLVNLANRFLPPGVLNLVLGDSSTGKALVAHPKVRMIALTGDVATGKDVAASAATTLKRVSLELGGKAPALVFADSPVRETARDLVGFGYSNSGQDCTAACRVIVEESGYDDFVSAFCDEVAKLGVGDPNDPATTMGPLVSRTQLERVAGFVDRARGYGAKVRLGGERLPREGWFYAPTVITEVDQSSEIIQREAFGPIVTIQRGRDEQEMLTMANDVAYGLSASVWTRDLGRAMRLTRELDFGTVWVNQHNYMASEMPFGGFRDSGYGKELSGHGLDEYSQFKHVMVNSDVVG